MPAGMAWQAGWDLFVTAVGGTPLEAVVICYL